MQNRLYYGDNLEILRNRDYFPNESVDLIYLDPPFNSNRNYNVLFKAESGADSEAQITAFEDTWHWSETSEATYHDLITDAPEKVATAIQALINLIDRNQMMAYLVMMAARLVELQRALKSTGSLYLHCDPTASHYLKILLDAIFGIENFRNEIVWKRTTAHSDRSQGNVLHMGRIHDLILFYTKTENAARNTVYTPYDEQYLKKTYNKMDENGRRYTLDNITGPGDASKGNPFYEVMGVSRFWRYTEENMNHLIEEGRIVQTKLGNVPRYKRYLDEMPGVSLQDIWDDINPLSAQAKERLGYPTQKPEELLERIIRASSNEGDVVLDPFCGCGTAIAAAHKLGRCWIGIDITHLSIALQKYRLQDMFELVSGTDYDVVGEPTTVDAARELAQDSDNEGRYQFEWWALSLLQAKPVGGQAGSRRGKKGSDKGIDGIINFFEEDEKGKSKAGKVILQVKSGKVKSDDIRDLKGTVERERAAIGVFITLEKPTRDMLKEALAAGYYESFSRSGQKYHKLQILTVGDLLDGAGIDMPRQYSDFKRAKFYKSGGVNMDGETQMGLFQKPGETPDIPGEYIERGPRGGKVKDPRHVTIEPGEKMPPTQEPGHTWEYDGPPRTKR